VCLCVCVCVCAYHREIASRVGKFTGVAASSAGPQAYVTRDSTCAKSLRSPSVSCGAISDVLCVRVCVVKCVWCACVCVCVCVCVWRRRGAMCE
jgi:hypothetical protein